MDPLDGNAIAGALFEHFGHEMTMAEVRCSHCHSTMLMAQLRVYMKAPGTVARCPACDEVVMVIVSVHNADRFDMSSIEMVSSG
jgi:hypothetical protein